MDLVLLNKGLDFTRKRKRSVLVMCALGLTGFGAYKIYNSPSVVKKRERLLKLLGAFVSVAEMVSDSAEAIGILSKDLKEFMGSDSDQIPPSLRQVSKITTSKEFSESLSRITGALTVGVLRGYQQEVTEKSGSLSEDSGFADRVVDKLFSSAGSGFASVVVGSFARNLVMAYLDDYGVVKSKPDQDVPRWVEVVCEDKCRDLIGECIRCFVSTACEVYLDKTMNINTYDDIFSGLTNPKHEDRVKDMLVSVCNGALETFVRTSHDVWTSNTNAAPKIDFEDNFCGDEKKSISTKLLPAILQEKKLGGKNQGSGWISKMSSTLSVPRNRKFVLDMTGMMTFETIRSFLEYLFKKLAECVKRSVDVVHHKVVDRGVEAVRYVSRTPTTVATVCLTICLHILDSPWMLAPC